MSALHIGESAKVRIGPKRIRKGTVSKRRGDLYVVRFRNGDMLIAMRTKRATLQAHSFTDTTPCKNRKD